MLIRNNNDIVFLQFIKIFFYFFFEILKTGAKKNKKQFVLTRRRAYEKNSFTSLYI